MNAPENALETELKALGIKPEELTQAMHRVKETLRDPWNYFDKGAFVPKKLAEAILDDYTIITPKDLRETYYYNPELGYYEPAQDFLGNKCTNLLQELTKRYRINETINYLQNITYAPESREPPVELINLKNGIYNFETGELQPHDPKYFFVGVLPVAYNPNVDCPNIKRFIREITANEKDALGLEEFSGYCLYRELLNEKAFMLEGSGRNGKTTFVRLLKALLGIKNVKSYTIQQITEQQYNAVELYGKLANISPDLPEKGIVDSGIWKALLGKDGVSGNKKFVQKSVDFQNYAKMIFTCNKIPETHDKSDGYMSRWIILNFPKQFLNENGNLKEHIFEDELLPELEGFLNLALEGLKRLKANRGIFSNHASIEETREKYIKSSDTLEYFKHKFCEETWEPEDYIIQDKFYAIYAHWMKQEGLGTPKPRKAVYYRMEQLCPSVEKKRVGTKHAWLGLKFKENVPTLTPTPITPSTSSPLSLSEVSTYNNKIGKDEVVEVVDTKLFYDSFSLLQQFMKQNGGEASLDAIRDHFEKRGLGDEVENTLDKLVGRGDLLRNKPGHYRATPYFLKDNEGSC